MPKMPRHGMPSILGQFVFLLLGQKCWLLPLILSSLVSSLLRLTAAMAHPNGGQQQPEGFEAVGKMPDLGMPGGDGPFKAWREQRMVRCIFCMNYDDYNNLSTFGCELKRLHTCWGNFCYMRQHKRPEYFLYTSGCINLTENDLIGLRNNVATLANEAGQRDLANWGNETQLCEVGQSVNTCICSNRHLCNNVTAVEPYIEYSDAIFTGAGIDFDELAHFRFLLPEDPILREFEYERSSSAAGGTGHNGNYLLVKDSAMACRRMPLLAMAVATVGTMLLSKLLAFIS